MTQTKTSFLEGIFCGRPLKQVTDLTATNTALTGSLNVANAKLASDIAAAKALQTNLDTCKANMSSTQLELNSQITDLTARNSTLTAQVSDLSARIAVLVKPPGPTSTLSQPHPDPIFSALPAQSQQAALDCWNKWQEVDANYTARYLGTDVNKTYPLDVKVFALEGQNDYKMKAKVKASNAFVADIMAQNPSLNAHQACDIAVMRIASSWMKNYLYDSSNWGRDEYWAFASEVDADECPGDDCDGMGVWKHVAYRIAGVPESLLRCTAGQTQNGMGHFTNHYLASDLTWRHLNSTLLQSGSAKITDMPKTNDKNDELGIAYVWFSFTDSRCFAQYTTDAQAESAKKAAVTHPFMKHIHIMPKGVGR